MKKYIFTITAACILATVFSLPIIAKKDQKWWEDSSLFAGLNGELKTARDQSKSKAEFDKKVSKIDKKTVGEAIKKADKAVTDAENELEKAKKAVSDSKSEDKTALNASVNEATTKLEEAKTNRSLVESYRADAIKGKDDAETHRLSSEKYLELRYGKDSDLIKFYRELRKNAESTPFTITLKDLEAMNTAEQNLKTATQNLEKDPNNKKLKEDLEKAEEEYYNKAELVNAVRNATDERYAKQYKLLEESHKALYESALDKDYFEDKMNKLKEVIKTEKDSQRKKDLESQLDTINKDYLKTKETYDSEYKKLNADEKKAFDILMDNSVATSPQPVPAPPAQVVAPTPGQPASPAVAAAGLSLATIWAWVKDNKGYTAAGTVATLIGTYIAYSMYKSVQEAYLQAENNEREKAILSQKIKQIDEQNRMLIEQIKKQHAEMQAEIVEKQKAAAAAAAAAVQATKSASKNKKPKKVTKKSGAALKRNGNKK